MEKDTSLQAISCCTILCRIENIKTVLALHWVSKRLIHTSAAIAVHLRFVFCHGVGNRFPSATNLNIASWWLFIHLKSRSSYGSSTQQAVRKKHPMDETIESGLPWISCYKSEGLSGMCKVLVFCGKQKPLTKKARPTNHHFILNQPFRTMK